MPFKSRKKSKLTFIYPQQFIISGFTNNQVQNCQKRRFTGWQSAPLNMDWAQQFLIATEVSLRRFRREVHVNEILVKVVDVERKGYIRLI